LDKCDIAGVWYVDFQLASFLIGTKFSRAHAEALFQKQIQVSGDRWLIKDFIPFQYGNLGESNKMFRVVSAKLDNFKDGAYIPHISPINGGMDKDKEKDMVKEVSKEESLRETKLKFEDFYFAYPRRVAKHAAFKAWGAIKPDQALFNRIMASVNAWAKTDQWQDPQFIPHPATFLNQKRWEDEIPSNKDADYETLKAKAREDDERVKRILSGDAGRNGTREVVRVTGPKPIQGEESDLDSGVDFESLADEGDFAGHPLD
jgi:hypothetical protein